MKKLLLLFSLLLISNVIMAQGRIDLATEHRGVNIQESTFKEIKSTFSFKSIESESMETESGLFSAISIDNTISGGNYGAPSLPIARELVAVPFGATPVVKILNYSVTDYKLDDYAIGKIYPQQQSMSKSAKQEDRVFLYDESAYNSRSLADAPKTSFEMLGTMRGIRLGALQVEPISYNPANNTIRVFNDIEVEVSFENADIALTEQTLLRTYSPYFDVIYKQLLNERIIRDFYDEYPDLTKIPVKMLVVANRMFEDAMQPWIEWKTQKGFYLDVKYTDEIGATSDDIKAYVRQQYAAETTPTFLILFGDEAQLPPSLSSGYDTQKVTDNYYASVDDDHIPDMYCSRMCCETVAEMSALIQKVLQYEQYTMPDPSYLENALLIAGYDYWENPKVGQPTIEYINEYYINEANGYNEVHKYLDMPYTGCYNHLSQGVGFALYTAHGLETCWDYPSFYASDVNSLTNTDKYFWAVGSCCLSGEWGYDASKSLGEAMICANKKGAWGYIGSCPVTYWWEDYYFSVGATDVTYRMPKYEETSMGCYDALWSDSYNVLSAVMYSGNLAVAYSILNDYPSSVTSRYYYEAYHTLGDGSVMPYRARPTANDVSHLYTIPVGANSFMIKAAPGSYVGISADGVLYGAGMIGETGTDNIPVANIPEGAELTIVVSHPDHYPYVEKINSGYIDGSYIVMDSYQLDGDDNGQLDYGDNINISLDVLNVGNATANEVVLELSSTSEYITMIQNTVTLSSVPNGEKVTADGLSFEVKPYVPNKTNIDFKLTATSGAESWETEFSMAAYAPKLSVNNITIVDDDGDVNPGETVGLRFDVKNDGGSTAYDVFAELLCSTADIEIEEDSFTKEELKQGEMLSVLTDIVIPSTILGGSMYQIGINASATYYKDSKIYELLVGSVIEGFETGDFSSQDWTEVGTNSWTISTESPYEGTYCAKSGDVTPSKPSSILRLTVEVLADDDMSYYRKVDSPDFDVFLFYIDGEEMDAVSGVTLWEYCKHSLSKGTHVLEWEFYGSSAGNHAYIDYLKLPPSTVVLFLDPVKDLEAEVEERTVALSWTANAPEYIIRRNGEEIATTTSANYTDEVAADGIYVYSVTAKYEEEYSAPASVTVNINTVDVMEVEYDDVIVYPNPTSGVIYVDMDAAFDAAVYNYQGQMMMRLNDNKGQIDMSSLTPGVYFVEIHNEKYHTVEKIILK